MSSRGATVQQISESRSLGDLALDLNLRPGPRFELGEVVATAGLEWEDAERLLTALGLPAGPEASITSEEAAAIRLLGAASSRLLGPDATIQVARVAGTSMARVAEVLVGAFRLGFELPRLGGGTVYSEIVKEYSALTERLLPMFVQTLDVVATSAGGSGRSSVVHRRRADRRHPCSHRRRRRPGRLHHHIRDDVGRRTGRGVGRI